MVNKNFFRKSSSSELLKATKGFTLLELLIVITILAVLSVAVIIVINPAETIRKARDTQRISDLSSMKTAISLYLSSVTTPYVGLNTTGWTPGSDLSCKVGDTWVDEEGTGRIHYSVASGTENITDPSLDGTTFTVATNDPAFQVATVGELGEVDGTGWIPVDLLDVTSGTPLSNFPVDPVNDVTNDDSAWDDSPDAISSNASAVDALNANALVYRYACHLPSTGSSIKSFEINATLESEAFARSSSSENKDERDGGNSLYMYEVGTRLDILGANTVDAGGTTGF